jgi:PAS domain S-box-containing protein
MQSLALNILTELICAPDGALDVRVRAALEKLAGHVGASRASLARLCESGAVQFTHEWNGKADIADEAAHAPLRAVIDFWRASSEKCEITILSSAAKLPAGLDALAVEYIRSLGALMLVPISDSGRHFGLAVLEFPVGIPVPKNDLAVFVPITQGFMAVLQRQDAAQVIQKSLAEGAAALGLLQATLDSLPDELTELDADGRYVHAQAGQREQFYLPPEQLIGRTLEEVLPAEVAAQRREMMSELERGERPEHRTYQLEVDGKKAWFHASATRLPARDPLGRPGYLFLSREVTGEVEQQRAFERLSDVARLSTNLVVVTDPDERVEWVNPAFEQRTGYKLEEIKGSRVGSLVQSPNTDQATRNKVRAALKARVPISAEFLNQTRSGEEYWVYTHLSPAFDASQTLTGFVGTSIDITERKKYAAELEEKTREAVAARQQLTDAIESLDEGFVLYDAQDKLVICNQKYKEFYAPIASMLVPGTGLEEIERQALAHGLLPQDERDREVPNTGTRAARNSAGSSRQRNLPDGRVLRVTERRTPSGECIGVHSDITGLKKAEQRLLNVIEAADVGVWEWNIDTGETRVNDRWAEILGHQRADFGEINFETWRSLVHPDDQERTGALLELCVSSKIDLYRAEYRMRHKAGHWVWILDRGKVIRRNADGAASFMAGVQIDVSEQRDREEALRRAKVELEHAIAERASAERRFLDISEVSDGWVWEQDEHLRYTFLSKSNFMETLGIKDNNLIGRTREEWCAEHPEVLASADWKGLQTKLDARQPFLNFVYRAPVEADHGERWLQISGVPKFDANGRFSGYRGVGADVSELYLAKARAEESNTAKSRFLANMSHEIRTPLNGVLGMAELLDSAITKPENKRMLATIRESGEALLNILNDILDMSKIEAGKLELESVAFRPMELIARVEELHSLRAQEKGLVFEILAGSGADQQRIGDPHRVRQILHNLISNAIKFTETGEVTVKLSGRKAMPLTIEVRDTGIGMTPAQVERLHEEFAQADSSITRRFGGTGLGMAITRNLVQLMGGEMNAISAPDQGTTITVVLPLEVAENVGDGAVDRPTKATSLQGLRILAADDNPTNCAVLQQMLARCGAVVTVVNNGKQAVEAWAPERYDAVLLDIAMPVMDGITAMQEIRALEAGSGSPEMPIIAVTANAMSHQVAEYLSKGFDSFVAKPVNTADLSHAVSSLVRRY